VARVGMFGLVLLAGLSCTKKVTQAGGLELMLMSDFPVTDLTRVHLEISQESTPGVWHKVFDREQLVPQEVSLPTYGTADESPGTDLTSGFPPGAGGGPTGTAGASLGKAGAGGSPNGPPGAGGSPGSAGAGPATGCAGPAPFRITSDVLSDFEATPSDLVRDVSQPGHWFSYDRNSEYHNLYSSVFTPDPGDWTVESPGHGGTGNAVHTTGRLNMVHVPAPHWEAGVGLSLATSGNNEATPIDVSAYAGISFYAKSSLGSAISVQFATVNTGSYCYCVASNNCTEDTLVITNVAPDWTQYTVRFADLLQPANFPFDSRGLVTIKFASNGSIPYVDFWIDDVRLIH